jgi:hypothetical protein
VAEANDQDAEFRGNGLFHGEYLLVG